ncbi:MAG: hypothetical protein ACTHU0_17340 [Kofleriaceae bacterium]
MQVVPHRHDAERAGAHERASAHEPRGWREQIGNLIGRSWAPIISWISAVRGARMFHPVGRTFVGRAEPLHSAAGHPLEEIGEALAGHVLARCSAALWKSNVERFDVLGMALRFRAGPISDHRAAPGDQDLLFATIRSPFTMLLSPLFTDASDFVGNRYWAVSPFEAPGCARVELRLVPEAPPVIHGSRDTRLRAAVAAGQAAWTLEARRTWTPVWHAVARIALERHVEIDQEALRFDPFRTGRGMVPVGLVHAIRRPVYAASQRARPDGEPTASG